jgi:uncharacterized membrane protein YkoI
MSRKFLPGVIAALASLGLAHAADCPPAVKDAVVKAHAGATVSSCAAEKEDGRRQYSVRIVEAGGEPLELDVSPAGAILKTEQKVAFDTLPSTVAAAFKGRYPEAKVSTAEKQSSADGKVVYEIAFATGKKVREASFAEDGTFIEVENGRD